MSRKYTWCFMGQVHAQGPRAKIIKALKRTHGEYYCNINCSWQSPDSLSTEDYRNILKQSIFAPCPKGNSSVDTFRVYESLECGAIPIVEKNCYWNNLLGKHPLLEIDCWDDLPKKINTLTENPEWIRNHSRKLESWWSEYKIKLSKKIKAIIKKDPITNKIKTQEFIKIKDQWKNFKDYDFLKYISNQIPETQTPGDKFTTYNSGNKIAIVSLYTPEISDYAIHSENSIRDYCEKQNYTFYVYREKLEENSSPNWSKAQAILRHINDHDYIVWMDSDTLIFNDEKKFEDIISKASRKFIFATKDIGDNSMLNSGVLIFKNHDYVKGLIKKWRDFDGDKTSLYASGGDQEILCDILKKSDGFGFNRKIFEMNEFNTDPRFVDEDTFILHFMAYPHELKKIFMSYWQNNFLTESL